MQDLYRERTAYEGEHLLESNAPADPFVLFDAWLADAFLAKDGSSTANASRITLADGRKVFAGSPTTPQDPPAAAPNGN